MVSSTYPMMNEDPYREDVWLARVIDKSADITIMLGINAKQFVSILLKKRNKLTYDVTRPFKAPHLRRLSIERTAKPYPLSNKYLRDN